MSYGCQDVVWDYVRPSSSFINAGTYAPPSTPRVHAFAAVPRTEPADCKTQPPVGGIGTDVCRGRRNPYRGGLGSFHLRFTYLREGGHQVSRSPGPGSYDTRHLTGGALVKRPKTASPCFRRPGGRLRFEGGGTSHGETPLVSAEARGTVRGSVKTQPQHYSLSFRSKADRLVVNKPPGTTHEGLGPGCYDVSKDGKSVGVWTEKRVVRGGCAGKGSTNQFLIDWRAYMKRPPKVADGYDDCGCPAGSDGRSSDLRRGKPERWPSSAPHSTPSGTPQTVSYTLKNQSERWPAARRRTPVAAGRRKTAGGAGLRLRESGQPPPRHAAPPQQHRHHPEEEEEEEEDKEDEEESLFPRRQQPQRSSSSALSGRVKRPASAVASLRIPSTANPLTVPSRCSGLPRRRTISGGGGSGLGSVLGGGSGDCSGSSLAALSASSAGVSGAPQLAPRPPSADTVARPRTACSAVKAAAQRIEHGVDRCGRGNGRQRFGGKGGIVEVGAPRPNRPLGGKPMVEEQFFSGMEYSPAGSSVPHATRLPTTAKSSRPEEKGVVAAGSEQPLGVIEDDAPPGASRPALPAQPRPPVNSAARSEDLRGEDSGGQNNGKSGAVAPKAANGSQSREPTARVEPAVPCSDDSHFLKGKAGSPTEVGREGVDQATNVPSSVPSPGAPAGRTTASSPPSPRRTSDTAAMNPSPESPRDCISPGEDNEADTRRASLSPPPAARASSSGSAVVAPALALASTAPLQAMPDTSVPRLTLTAGDASSKPSTGGDGEGATSALWRIQSKGSFTLVLGMLQRRSHENSQAAAAERARVDPLVARLAAGVATEAIVGGALSAVVASRLSLEAAASPVAAGGLFS